MASKSSADIVHLSSSIDERYGCQSKALLLPVLRVPDTCTDHLLYQELADDTSARGTPAAQQPDGPVDSCRGWILNLSELYLPCLQGAK